MTRRFFGTDGVRGVVGGDVINAEFALRLGYAAGKVLTESKQVGRPTVLIGKDTRISGYMLESALEAGFSSAGVDTILCGPMPTPAIAYLTRALRLSAGVVISASHNPYQDNGIKFFSGKGIKLPDEVELAIEARMDQPMQCADSTRLGKAQRAHDADGRYIEFCKSTFPSELNLNGLRLVVDCAHGAAYHIAPHVFRELGAEVISVGVSPNGFNINDGVGATHVESLQEMVRLHRADYGLALDGDADRLQMVDSDCRAYNGDELLYAIVKQRMGRGRVEGVVGTLMTNFALEKRLTDQGVGFARAAVGDRYVLERLQEKGWCYGGESSGHLLCLDKHTTGDGIVSGLQVLAAIRQSNQSLPELLSDLTLYPQELVNVKIAPGFDWKNHAGLARAITEVEKRLDGMGRLLIRASGTEPKLRLMVEAPEAAQAQSCAAYLAQALANPA